MVLSEKEKEILKRAIELEESGKPSWTWWEVKAFPAELTKLVVKGFVEIVSKKSSEPTKYRVNREAVKKVIV